MRAGVGLEMPEGTATLLPWNSCLAEHARILGLGLPALRCSKWALQRGGCARGKRGRGAIVRRGESSLGADGRLRGREMCTMGGG